MTLDLATIAASAWPSTMPPPKQGAWATESVAAAGISAALTREERAELLDIAQDAKRYRDRDMTSTERRAQPGRRSRVMHLARRLGIQDVVSEVIDAGCREPGLSSTEDHIVNGTRRACEFMLRAHVSALCLAADAEF